MAATIGVTNPAARTAGCTHSGDKHALTHARTQAGTHSRRGEGGVGGDEKGGTTGLQMLPPPALVAARDNDDVQLFSTVITCIELTSSSTARREVKRRRCSRNARAIPVSRYPLSPQTKIKEKKTGFSLRERLVTSYRTSCKTYSLRHTNLHEKIRANVLYKDTRCRFLHAIFLT